jgi:hypothetical protein
MNFNRPNLTDKELEELQSYYQDTFSRSRFGNVVLTNILYRLGLFDMDVKTYEEQTRQNFARELMFLCGILDGKAENCEEIVEAWTQIRPKSGGKGNAG